MSTPADQQIPLRQPSNLVSPKAVGYWRMSALFRWLLLAVLLSFVRFVPLALLARGQNWSPGMLLLVNIAIIALLVAALLWSIFVPQLRYQIHRWELTEEALFTQSGWVTRALRVAPLSRIQTVDSRQTATMRWFGLTSVIAANASSAGSIHIDCLDAATANELVAQLTAITSASKGDGA